jgi:acetyl-CoA carboxylase biotin carboxyl carrier protein
VTWLEAVREVVAAPADEYQHVLAAPFTGVFDRSPTPAARPVEYVSDAAIGLVETMKMFNEATADVSGRIVRVLADNGQRVHAGDGLAAIEPGERATAGPELHP